MRQLAAHDYHGDHEKLNKLSHDHHETNGRYTNSLDGDFHESSVSDESAMFKRLSKARKDDCKLKPSQETLKPSRNLIRLVNRDPVFESAKRLIGLFPQVAYKLVKTAGIDRTRMVTAFIVDLWSNEYFAVDKQGKYDPTLEGSRQRARNALLSIIYGKKPIYLTYASQHFFKLYPELRDLMREQGESASI